MLKLAADENFNNIILRGVLQRNPRLDIVRVQDSELSGQSDPAILEWASQEGRIILTHDITTVTKFAYERIRAGLPMAGVLEVPRKVLVRQAIEEILLAAECSLTGEWESQVRYLPL